ANSAAAGAIRTDTNRAAWPDGTGQWRSAGKPDANSAAAGAIRTDANRAAGPDGTGVSITVTGHLRQPLVARDGATAIHREYPEVILASASQGGPKNQECDQDSAATV